MNGGTCIPTPTGTICNCRKGYTGANCKSEIDECQSQPCKYGKIMVFFFFILRILMVLRIIHFSNANWYPPVLTATLSLCWTVVAYHLYHCLIKRVKRRRGFISGAEGVTFSAAHGISFDWFLWFHITQFLVFNFVLIRCLRVRPWFQFVAKYCISILIQQFVSDPLVF